MDYNLEALGEDRFQKLCQSLLAATYPNVQCLPTNQPDGGRDAFSRSESASIVFQVKFSRQPSLRSERDAISALIATEQSKVAALVKRGATSYILMTNIAGTAHLDVGSIDQTQAALSAAFGIPTMCWWRDDIERRIEAVDGLIWRYPELIRTTDFLEALSVRRNAAAANDAIGVYRAYMDAQYQRDSEVKFQQVQIQNSLLDLFTDTPLGLAREKQPRSGTNACDDDALQRLSLYSSQENMNYVHRGQYAVLAADWLLEAAPQTGLQRIVLEGAPGQGKSTVTQYLCQINRIKSGDDFHIADQLPPRHLDHTLRLPFRIDLRDYSAWLIGHDPFVGSKAVPRPSGSPDTLESFIAHQIAYLSGGQAFNVDSFYALIKESHCLIVLDGFDEVADIPTRIKIIDQTRLLSARIQRLATSIQLIVTSRPNAFILSPGFPEREWMHLSLRPLQMAQISEYADKWISAKELSAIKGREFKELLGDRVSRPHIRSLAQNPMQLAILLNLINTKGLSLPDKRTALYESYMDLFFGREAEKDEVVRENRDVLMQVHEYVAWLLQTDAERPGGAGSMTQQMLEEVVRSYLDLKGHEVDVLSLFKGAVERVGALVSRVQGMLEFEVQPLREYFAGRYLYVSAPYSTLSSERGGARPRHFTALAKRPYWINVARFYAGCYNSGELASILTGLQEIYDEPSEALKSHSLQLALLLLSDWVFAQEPRIVGAVVDFLTKPRNFERLITAPATWEDNRLNLPSRCGRAAVGQAGINHVFRIDDAGTVRRAGDVAVLNTSFHDRLAAWQSFNTDPARRLLAATALGIIRQAPRDELDNLFAQIGPAAIEQAVSEGRWEDLSPGELGYAMEQAAQRLNFTSVGWRMQPLMNEALLARAFWFLNPANLTIFKYNEGHEFKLSQLDGRYGFPGLSPSDREKSSAVHLDLVDFTAACERAADADRSSWVNTLVPWSDLVESGRRTWGETYPLRTLALAAAGIQSRSFRSQEFDDLLASHLPLAERARHARLRTTSAWWLSQWNRAETHDQLAWISLCAICWAAGPVLEQIANPIGTYLAAMEPTEFDEFCRSVRIALAVSPGGRPKIAGYDAARVSGMPSIRLAAALGWRLGEQARRRVLTDLAKRDSSDDAGAVIVIYSWLLSNAPRDPALWETTVDFASKYEDIIRDYSSMLDSGRITYYGARSGMPRKIADTFLREATFRPLAIVEAAAASVRHFEQSDRRPLAVVAEAENWFDDP